MTHPVPVRVLVVDDSATTRAALTALLEADECVRVVGQARDGAEAVALTQRLRPSLVVMDVEMPNMDGFEATKRIMMAEPTPIVIVSARDDVHQVEVGLRAVRAGALTVVPKPAGPPGSAGFAQQSRRLTMLVKALADVKVVRQRSDRSTAAPVGVAPRRGPGWAGGTVEAVAVAASTGGPAALYRFLESLPRTLDIPVLVVQHIAHGFIDGLAQWLASATVLPVCVAGDGQQLTSGQVYLAPDDHHLLVGRGRVRLSQAPPDRGFRPSANTLFTSLAASHGRHGAAVVLTGMGEDGVDGAARVRDAGGLVLAQDSDTSVVYGMPRAVAAAGLADAVGPVEELAYRIIRCASKKEAWP